MLYNYLILFLYSFSFSITLTLSFQALILSSLSFSSIYKRYLIISLIVGAPYMSFSLYKLRVRLPLDDNNLIILSFQTLAFSTLLVTIRVIIGNSFFLGITSTNTLLELLLIGRRIKLSLAPPYLPSLFLFSRCLLSFINASLSFCLFTLPYATNSNLFSFAIPLFLIPFQPFRASISTLYYSALLEIRGNYQETLLQLVVQ